MKKEESKSWYAILTGSRKEKFVAKRLERKGVTAYLPLIKRTRRYSSRIKSHELPLISCYVFVQISSDERLQVLETEYVRNFIQFDNKAAVIPDIEIETMRHIVGQYADVEMVSGQHFQKGTAVELIAGELTGIKGIVIEERGSKRYLVRLQTLGLQLTWVIKASKLRKV